MRLRPGVDADVAAAMALVGRVVPPMRAAGNLQWDDAYPNAAALAEDVRLGQLWVIEEDGGLVAMAAFTTDQEPEYRDAGWDFDEAAIVVHRLAVDPAQRGRGLAERLMGQAEAVALVQGILVVRGDTNTVNATAARLFVRMGYTWAGEIGLGFRPGMRFACYEKRLERSVGGAPPVAR